MFLLRVNEDIFTFFSVFCNTISGRNEKLRKETFTALHHKTYAFLALT